MQNNIPQKPLMYDKKTKQYLYLGEPKCHCCQKKLDSWFTVVYYFGRDSVEAYEYCVGCFQARRRKHKLYVNVLTESIYMAVSVNKRPVTAMPIIIEYPDIQNGTPRDMFDYWARRGDDTVTETKDNTIHAKTGFLEKKEKIQIGVNQDEKRRDFKNS